MLKIENHIVFKTAMSLLAGSKVPLLLVVLLCPTCQLSAADWTLGKAPLLTRWAAEITPTNVWPEYPRPQLVRTNWLNLNGLWDYAVTIKTAPQPEAYEGRILVPYPIESALSGVMKQLHEDEQLWYHRQISIPPSWRGQRIKLHFGAVDWRCRVWINGQEVGRHQGGYDAFTFDITPALRWDGGENIVLGVEDATGADQPRGKQSIKGEGIFYTSTSGIWQTVWLEPVPAPCIDGLKLIPDLKSRSLSVEVAVASIADDLTVEVTALDDDQEVGRVSGPPGEYLLLPIANPRAWIPADPFLYNLQVKLMRKQKLVDSVGSYFGMRNVSLKHDKNGHLGVALNDQMIFQVGIMDQGFWPDGIYTPPAEAAMKADLEFAKSAGFNLVRKHVKVEPERWYYWCDKLGLLVWQDMPSGNNTTAAGRVNFEVELQQMISGLYNHPSIIQWTLFNEGWGQYNTERLVSEIKSMDPTRLVDSASGWTDMSVGDIVDTHNYPDPQRPVPQSHRAAVIGEFGGVNFQVTNHNWSGEFWGYQDTMALSGVTAWYFHFMRSIWNLKETSGLAAAVYTQLTDVETECDGLMTYDRKVQKVDPAALYQANHEMADSRRGRIILPGSLQGLYPWRYTFMTPAGDWTNPAFDDTQWREGPAGFGSGFKRYATVRTTWDSGEIWVRRAFQLDKADLAEVAAFKLELLADPTEVYLNGELTEQNTNYLVDYQSFDLAPKAIQSLHAGTNVISAHCRFTSRRQYFDAGIFLPNSASSETTNTSK